MKLGPLKSAIRDLPQAPKFKGRGWDGTEFDFHLQKTPLLAELDRLYPDRGETGYAINSEGYLTKDPT